MPNHTETRKFLQAVFPKHALHAIFAYKVAPGGMGHVRSFDLLPGGSDCYWSIASFPADKSVDRLLSRALGVGALVIDDVGTKVPSVGVTRALGLPTAVVETSLGNYQWTYRLSEEIPVDAWRGFFAGIESVIGSRLEGRDAVHLFRLPFGVNSKPGRDLFKPRITGLNASRVLDVSQVFDAVLDVQGLIPARPGPARPPEPRVRNIGGLLDLIPNDDESYDMWIARAHQAKALALDEEEGREAFDAWSRKSSKYNAAETARRWETVKPSRTAGLEILRDAEAADPDGFSRVMNKEATSVFDDGVEPPPPPPPPSHSATGGSGLGPSHKTMADEVVRLERGRLGWINGRAGSWAAFDDVMRRWVISSNEAAMHQSVREAIERYLGRSGVGSKAVADLHKAGWHHSVASLVRIRQELRVEASDFDADNNMLGLPGSVLEMAPGGLGVISARTGSAGDFVTKSTSTGVAAPGARGRYWEKFLDDFTQKDPELRRWWQVFCGYCLSGHTGEHVVVFVYGPGGNGKSVFLDMIGEVMGDYHERADHRVFMESKGGKHLSPLAVLEGARLVTVPDVAVGASWDMGLVKQASGGGSITANRMRQDPRTFVPRFKIVMAGNEKPRLDTVDDGVRRRMRLVPALFRPKAVDVGLVDKLRGEKAEILRWMVDGWSAWGVGGLPACRVIEAATTEYLDGADIFGRWVAECVGVSAKGKVRMGDAFRSWDAFRAQEGGYSTAPTQAQQLSTKLKEGGFLVKRDNGGAFLADVELVNNPKTVF